MSIEKKWDPVGSIGFLSPLGNLRQPYGFNNEHVKIYIIYTTSSHPEVFLQKGALKICSKLQENTHADMQFVKSHFSIGALLWICFIFWEHLFSRTLLGSCFCICNFFLCSHAMSSVWKLSEYHRTQNKTEGRWCKYSFHT